MATFKELMQLASISKSDKTSLHRLHEIEKILRKYHALTDLTPEKATKILEELGPTFVKMGQLASDRSDIIPKSYAMAFRQLRTNVDPEPFPEIVATIEHALGHPWQETFVSIDENPIGAASIAQVHKAVLRAEGNPVVAIKVRRSKAAELMAQDFTLIKHALAIADVTIRKQSVLLTMNEFVAELEKTSLEELDFTLECHNLERFEKLLATTPGVKSPHPYSEISTDEMLVMEYIEGIPINHIDELKARGLDVNVLSKRLAENFIVQVLDWGFFHADPHQGNIIVRDGDIVWIDLGMMGNLTSSERAIISDICTAIARNDAFSLKDNLLTIARARGAVDHGLLLRQLSALVRSYTSVELSKLDMGSCLYDIIELLRSQNLILPASLTMLARGAVAIEGVLTEISPSTSVINLLTEHVKKQLFSLKHIEHHLRDMVSETVDAVESSVRIPAQVEHVLEIIERGELQASIDMDIPMNFMDVIRSVSSILALSLITAGLFVGSSLIALTGMEPKVLQVPVFGFLGFITAVGLSVYIVWRCMALRRKERRDEEKTS